MDKNIGISNEDKLMVVWTSGDREVALKMVFMYTRNSIKKGWWDKVRLVVWGPSTKLLSKDVELQAYIREMKEIGIELFACKACTDMYGVSEALENLGIEVIFMGEPLTDALKSDWKVITF